MLHKALRLFFIALFFVLLSLPLLQQFFHIIPDTAVQENRNKAKLPTDISALFSGGDFAHRFEQYFNDSYGLRDNLIKLHNQIQYSLFKTSDRVLIGPDGWLFYKHVYEDGIRNTESQAHRLPKLFERIERLSSSLAARGITLVVAMCPLKFTVYPEKLPAAIVQPPQHSVFQKFRSFLNTHSSVKSVDVYARLMELKRERQVYHKTDFHWNDPAGAVVMKDLIRLLGVLSHTGVTWTHPLTISIDKQVGGGEINSLAVYAPPLEDMLMVADNPANGVGALVSSPRPNEWVYTANEKSPAVLLPPTVLFGDSYADAFLRSGLTLPFSRLQKFYNLEFKEKFREIPEGTKFVVLEFIEGNLFSMLTDEYWPEELR
jgi:hypothetical protein